MKKSKETLVALISDMHIGKLTLSFNIERARKMMERWMDKILRIKELLGSGYIFDELVVASLGDINDGTEIYATQPHHQAITNVLLQAEVAADIIATQIKRAHGHFRNVTFVGVAGNHGRAGKRAHEAANWDIATYKLMKAMLPKTRFVINERDDFLMVHKVKGHGLLLYHGHYIRMYAQVPWYGIITKVLKWAQSVRDDWRVACFGHFHSCGYTRLNGIDIFLNGTLVTDDLYPMMTLGLLSSNKWWLFGVSERHATTFKFDIDVAS